jgi:hypothetical protein
MSGNKYSFMLLLFLLPFAGRAQEQFTSQPAGRGDYSLVMYLNAGAGYFLSSAGRPDYLHPETKKFNPLATVRILWHPDHMLKVGLESGYVTFYSYRLRDDSGKEGTISLNAVPVLLVWSMSVTRHFNIFAGSGAYFMNTKLDYGTTTIARKFNVGWMAAASYIFPLGKNSGLGTEAKWLYAAETSRGVLCVQLQYVWKFIKW